MKEDLYNFIMTLWTATELKLAAVFSFICASFSWAVGGIDTPITFLFALICIDVITGLIASFILKEWSSRKGHRGLCKKGAIFFCIMIAYFVDMCSQTNMFRIGTIGGFGIIEAMSIVENIDRMGMGWLIPEFFRNKLIQIRKEKVESCEK